MEIIVEQYIKTIVNEMVSNSGSKLSNTDIVRINISVSEKAYKLSREFEHLKSLKKLYLNKSTDPTYSLNDREEYALKTKAISDQIYNLQKDNLIAFTV